MMFWAVALFILMWRYLHGGRRHQPVLGLSAAILASDVRQQGNGLLAGGDIRFHCRSSPPFPRFLAWIRREGGTSAERAPPSRCIPSAHHHSPCRSGRPLVGLFQGLLGLTLANPDPLTGNNVANIGGSDRHDRRSRLAGQRTCFFRFSTLPWTMHMLPLPVAGDGCPPLASQPRTIESTTASYGIHRCPGR